MTDAGSLSKAGGADREVERRDFLYIAAGAAGVVGTAFAAWPFIDSMNPSADVLALSSIEVDRGGKIEKPPASRSVSGSASSGAGAPPSSPIARRERDRRSRGRGCR